MTTGWEIAANAAYAVSVFLAARNSVHNWWTGIIGSILFAYVFFSTQLYADVTLQAFFVVTNIWGWWAWLHGHRGDALPVRRTPPALLGAFAAIAIVVAIGHGYLLYRFTDAYQPYLDSIVLTVSVLAQFLLMARRIETWFGWLIVNTIAVPLYASRGLTLTAILYAFFWVNAIYGFLRWRRELRAGP
jgi:nicotinamide mononucleotide transporter